MEAQDLLEARDLFADPNALAPHYSRFRVTERLLLDGHSHQAWPDCSLEGQIQAWDDAAEHLGEKWDGAFEKADDVRRGFTRLMDDGDGQYALASNTHELLLRFLSALPWKKRQRLVTTDGEFHTIHRQLRRLEEEGVEVVRVASSPAEGVAERLAAAVDARTAAILTSSVFFRSGQIATGLKEVVRAGRRVGAEILVDTYHSLNVAPFSIRELGLEEAFAVGGGYKYCQLGEGNCFLRIPPGRTFRPVFTGWFSEFSALEKQRPTGPVVYGVGPDVFAGSTYDPTSHYRASRVFRFFHDHGLSPQLLRQVSQHQIEVLRQGVDALDLPASLLTRDHAVPLEGLGGFLALRSPKAGEICDGLRARGVRTDHRQGILRLGPAPYLSDRQLRDTVGLLGETVCSLEDRA